MDNIFTDLVANPILIVDEAIFIVMFFNIFWEMYKSWIYVWIFPAVFIWFCTEEG